MKEMASKMINRIYIYIYIYDLWTLEKVFV